MSSGFLEWARRFNSAVIVPRSDQLKRNVQWDFGQRLLPWDNRNYGIMIKGCEYNNRHSKNVRQSERNGVAKLAGQTTPSWASMLLIYRCQ